MDIVQQDNVSEQVSSLGQIGFEFPQEHQCKQNESRCRKTFEDLIIPDLNIALSPNACAAVSFADTTDIHLGLIQMPLRDDTESLQSCD